MAAVCTSHFSLTLCCCLPLPCRAAMSFDRRKSQLELYFEEHQIESRLNLMLNDMVLSRPSQPYSWLARRMRRDEARAPASRTTMPQLDAASAAAYLGADVEKAWGYALSMQTPASGAPAPAAAAKGKAAGKPAAKGAKAGGLTLSIEPLGSGVLLSIRKA